MTSVTERTVGGKSSIAVGRQPCWHDRTYDRQASYTDTSAFHARRRTVGQRWDIHSI